MTDTQLLSTEEGGAQLMRWLIMTSAILVTLFHAPASAQSSPVAGITVEIGDRPVLGAPDGLPITEPHLAVNPEDLDHMVAGAIVVHEADMSRRDCAVLSSFDGGASWLSHQLGEASCGDPWVAILPNDVVLLTVLGAQGLLLYRSEDRGVTWPDSGTAMGTGHDHETMVVDETRGPAHGTVYLTSVERAVRPETAARRDAVHVARSGDGGLTWSVNRLFPFNLSFNVMTPVVLSDGELVVSFSDYSRRAPEGGAIWMDYQRDWVVRSPDGGSTFSVPLFVTDLCERSFSTLAADRSDGRFRDRLYYVCHDEQFRQVYLFHSSDRGESWSDPVIVSTGAGRRGYVRTPAMAVNSEGVVGVSWYDGRDGGGAYRGIYRCQNVFFGASFDGGESFLSEVPVSTELSCPDTPENGEAGRRFPAGGDYHGLVALPDGRFVILWSDSRDGRYALRTATVRAARITP